MTDTSQTSVLVLEQILDSVHPLMAEGLYLAAVPHWYNAPLFATMRQRDDGRDVGLIERLLRYSFIVPLGSDGDEPTYMVREEERVVLQRRWIAKDATAYLAAHKQALAYWQAHPDSNEYAQAQNILYHLLFVDLQAAKSYLIERFSQYYHDRQLSAIDRLLETAVDARFYLAMLSSDSLGELDDLTTHLRTCLLQLRGQWADSRDQLAKLSQKPDLADDLRPYVLRSYGDALVHTGDFVGAIEQYDQAIALYRDWAATAVGEAIRKAKRSQARAMIARGDAHVSMAQSIRGYSTDLHGLSMHRRWLISLVQIITTIPLLMYLSFYLGRRVWHPRFWPAILDLDWIVARLFATGARMYNEADPILELNGSHAEGVAADEKLAFLYLTMGDSYQARALFEQLLAEDLGEYRLAAIRSGLGEALLRSERPSAALEPLYAALPILHVYEDLSLIARTHYLLGEALCAAGEDTQAIRQLTQAVQAYQRLENWAEATNVAERMDLLAKQSEWDGDLLEQTTAVTSALPLRQYNMQYRHPLVVYFRRIALVLLAFAILLIPLLTIYLDSGSTLSPTIRFQPTPILSPDDQFAPELAQGVTTANIGLSAATDTVFWLAIGLAIAYFLFSFLIGLLLIMRTRLKTVQKQGQSGTVWLDEVGITVGAGEAARQLNWEDGSLFVKADVQLQGNRLQDGSSFAVTQPDNLDRLVVRGYANWYGALRERVAAKVSHAQTINLDHMILSRSLGAVYWLNLVLVGIVAFIAKFASHLIWVDLLGSPYSIGDLYPYLFFGLFSLPVWWGLVRPLRVRLYLSPTDSLPRYWMATAVVLTIIYALLRFRPLLTVADIYPPLLILLLAVSGSIAIWRVKVGNQHVYSAGVRVGVAVVATAVAILMIAILTIQTTSYHYLVKGNTYRDQVISAETTEEALVLYEQAITAYDQAIAISERPILGIDTRRGAFIRFGIPTPSNFIWQSAMNSQAALRANLGSHRQAYASYSILLNEPYKPYANRPDQLYIWRAITLQGWGTASADQNITETNEDFYAMSQQDFEDGIKLNPHQMTYYLWQAVTYHTLNKLDLAYDTYEIALNPQDRKDIPLTNSDRERALTGQGWVRYAQGQYAESDQLFRQAIAANPKSSEAWVGLGYANYSQGNYAAAGLSWEKGQSLAPDDPIIAISLGTLSWKLAGQADGLAVQCELYAKSVSHFQDSTGMTGQTAQSLGFTYRTMAQVASLLIKCYDDQAQKQAQYETVIDLYTQAIAQDSRDIRYFANRGRWRYAYWTILPDEPQYDYLLDQALADLTVYYNQDLNDDTVNRFRTAVLNNMAKRGRLSLDMLDEDEVTTAVTNFGLGLSSIMEEDWELALTFYEKGMQLAAEEDNKSAVVDAANALSAYLLENRDVDETAVYPILLPVGDATAVGDLPNPRLYWHFRADFAFQLLNDLFVARPENDSVYIALYDEAVIDPITRANEIDHTFWYDFYTGTNGNDLGWFRLRRGDAYYETGDFANALSDYESAFKLIVVDPDSDYKFSANDGTEAGFKVGLTALQLGDFELAQNAYHNAYEHARIYEPEGHVVPTAISALNDLRDENPDLDIIITEILADLEYE